METTICRIRTLNWYFENEKGETCGRCDVCKNINSCKTTQSKFIEFINKNLSKNPVNLFSLEGYVAQNFEKYSSLDYLYQLIIDNKINYDRKDHTVTLNESIDEKYEFQETIEITMTF